MPVGQMQQGLAVPWCQPGAPVPEPPPLACGALGHLECVVSRRSGRTDAVRHGRVRARPGPSAPLLMLPERRGAAPGSAHLEHGDIVFSNFRGRPRPAKQRSIATGPAGLGPGRARRCTDGKPSGGPVCDDSRAKRRAVPRATLDPGFGISVFANNLLKSRIPLVEGWEGTRAQLSHLLRDSLLAALAVTLLRRKRRGKGKGVASEHDSRMAPACF